ncbi:MAG: TonB-dependent receptor [Deltaproteobacteria bacterium]|nr:TonB-dependent receptor [Deltaproteobacteria bacterium]
MGSRLAFHLGILGVFILTGVSHGLAQEESNEVPGNAERSGEIIMEEVVVTATRYEKELKSVPAQVLMITKEDIENSTAKNIPDILRTMAGMYVTDITGNRKSYRIDVRGFGETSQSNTLVLVDGRRINQPDLGGTDWTLIPIDRVERIEIIKGSSGSVIYGDNATGGVINIITREAEKFGAGVLGAAGSYSTYNASAHIGDARDTVSYAFSGSYYESDGYRDNSGTRAKDLGANLYLYLFEDTAKVSLSAGYHDDDTRLPGALKKSELESGISRRATKHPDDFANTDDHYVKISPEVYFLDNSLFKIDFSYRKRDALTFSSFSGGTFEGDTEITTKIASPQFVIREPLLGFKNNLTFGVDWIDAEEDILNTTLGAFPSKDIFEMGKENSGYYVHDEFYLMNDLIISAGYRHDKVEYSFWPSTPDSADYDEDLFTIGINYRIHRDSYIYFSFSDGFRYPVLDELFDFFSNTIDTTLVPQTSDNYEIGIRHRFGDKLYVNLNLFRLDTKKEIFFNPTGGPFGFGTNENLDGETRREGIGVTLGRDFKNFGIKGSYTFTDTEIRGGQFAGKEVPAVPKHHATVNAMYYPMDKITIVLEGVYVGKRFFESDFQNTYEKQDDYFVLNGRFSYFWKKLTAFLDINNLFGREYSEYGVLSSGAPVEPAFYPSPERSVFLGVRYEY